ncbi:MAG TPA: MinD/ParA family protein [Nitrospirota bacterium]|nr:MinD/ParA family protein [Nitrospirota bacterium]
MLSVGRKRKKYVKTIAVASGKGGVGKTNITASLAIALRNLGKNVVIVDADLGLSNINILLNKHAKYNISHLLEGKVELKDILIEGPHGVKILPAGEGVQYLTRLDEFQRLRLLEAFDSYDGDIDILLIDNSAGISENVTFFCSAAQDLIVVTTPEPTAWVDAYHLIKILYTEYQENKFHVIVNSVKNEAEGLQVFETLTKATNRFLNISLDYLGYLPYDNDVKKAVRSQTAFIDLFPRKFISKCMGEIAAKILERPEKVKGTLQFFIGSLLSLSADAVRVRSRD